MYILDCTLRDGGYLNNWQFSPEEIQDYLDSLQKYNVNIAEIGFRYLKKDDSLGICAYCPDKFIDNLQIPDNLQIAVMIKAEQIRDENDLHHLFTEKSNSRLDLVRIAVQYEKATNCRKITEILKNKGYKVALNLTKLSKDSEIRVPDWETVDVLYFADTFGELYPDEVKNFIDGIKKEYAGSLGFHGHNNKGLALKNTLTAMECGVTYVDSTINGVGKGAGNLKTEDLIWKSFKGFDKARQ
ncbi:MAG: hypothetical protein A2Y25_06565 [Candidatus Melainabacteria bacterium GWF2_37_15]|nr:MAG: hypothetical protein A2Y25_06565 [Candidatus Melainabacteria bacterium GWF2_37_15]